MSAGKRNLRLRWLAAAVPAALIALGCAAVGDSAPPVEATERMLGSSFTAPAPELLKCLDQDRSQTICSKIGKASPTQTEAAEVVKLARGSIHYPASGKLIGDWKIGEKLAHDGAGDRIQFGRLEKRKENGGLCQNCHALEAGEVNVGNVGPSLTGYGAQRGNWEAIAKFTYEKIYNAWVYFPCSNMPRLGANGHLTPEQVSHLVAYLVDPRSPLNKK
ncbi:MAG: sulfur oxidation c-type cytochrome SoxX [Burkholderiales bacterium]